MKFQILIPTYNRCNDLRQNLIHLHDQILRDHLQHAFSILVSDNASTDGTGEMLENIKKDWVDGVDITIIRNQENIGLEPNVVSLLQQATGDYLIWLGDDDFLADGYLRFIDEQFTNDEIGWMIPGLQEVDKHGHTTTGRPVEFTFRKFPRGYSTVHDWSHLAHQMSGLVVRRAGLLDHYLASPQWRNPYLFIFFTAWSQMHYDGIYAPAYQSQINNFNPKDWGYNKVGLLDEVFKSYYYLIGQFGVKAVHRLLIRFVIMHSYRLNFDKGLLHVYKQGKMIADGVPHSFAFSCRLYFVLAKEYLARKLRS